MEVCHCGGGHVCGVCVCRMGVVLVSRLAESGDWMAPSSIEALLGSAFRQTVTKLALRKEVIVRDDGRVGHIHRGLLVLALESEGTTSMVGWSKSALNFALRHGAAHGLWCDARMSILKKATKYNMHNAATIVEAAVCAGATGLSVCDVVIEYPLAYIDLFGLLAKETGVLRRLESRLWHSSVFHLKPRTSRKRQRKVSLAGTTRAAAASSARH